MKFILWLVLILFVASLVFFGVLIGSRIDYYQYERDIVSFSSKGLQNGVTAHFDGMTVQLNQPNFDVMCNKLFTISERKSLRKLPNFEDSDTIIIEVDEHNIIKIIPASKDKKDVYLYVKIADKNRYFYISEHYLIYERALSYVSPEGFYGPNTLLTEP